MFGTVSAEKEVNVPASEAWKVYGTLQFAKIAGEKIPSAISKIDVVQGDGAVGTILQVFFAPGEDGSTRWQKEKFVVIDNEKRMKEVEVVEGGFLDMGFTMYKIRLEVIEKGDGMNQSCITKATIEYEVPEEAAANAAYVSIQPFVAIMEVVANHMLQNHSNNKN